MACCGKMICSGCINEVVNKDMKCACCKALPPMSMEEVVEKLKKLAEANDADAIFQLGMCYDRGDIGFPQDNIKALELLRKAAKLECAKAYTYIGIAYRDGKGVEVDEEKEAFHYICGGYINHEDSDVNALYNLAKVNLDLGDLDRAVFFYMSASKGGKNEALDVIRELYSGGYATKGQYMLALKFYQEYLDEIKSDQRDKAAALSDVFRYY